MEKERGMGSRTEGQKNKKREKDQGAERNGGTTAQALPDAAQNHTKLAGNYSTRRSQHG